MAAAAALVLATLAAAATVAGHFAFPQPCGPAWLELLASPLRRAATAAAAATASAAAAVPRWRSAGPGALLRMNGVNAVTSSSLHASVK